MVQVGSMWADSQWWELLITVPVAQGCGAAPILAGSVQPLAGSPVPRRAGTPTALGIPKEPQSACVVP